MTHVFEKAGLGKAPFRFVGYSREVYQAVPGDPNCPLQPGASCDYCSEGLFNVYHIESADGKRFKVGCECVKKTGDKGIVDPIMREARRQETMRRHEREDAKIAAAKELYEVPANRELCRKHPHPDRYLAARNGWTTVEFADWMFENAGRSGKLRAARRVERIVKTGKCGNKDCPCAKEDN